MRSLQHRDDSYTGETSTIAFWGRSMGFRQSGLGGTCYLFLLFLGAVTALLYADEDNMLDAMVLDSPFASLRMYVFHLCAMSFRYFPRLAEELIHRATANSSIKVPGFAVAGVLRLVRSTIQKRAKVDINDIVFNGVSVLFTRLHRLKHRTIAFQAAIDHVAKMYVPALFCVVRSDSFISNWHSDLLHANYAGLFAK